MSKRTLKTAFSVNDGKSRKKLLWFHVEVNFFQSEKKLVSRSAQSQSCLCPFKPVTKTEFSKTLFKLDLGYWKRRLFVFVWTENILKTELLENNGRVCLRWSVTENMWCVFRVKPPCSIFSGVLWTGRKTLQAFWPTSVGTQLGNKVLLLR